MGELTESGDALQPNRAKSASIKAAATVLRLKVVGALSIALIVLMLLIGAAVVWSSNRYDAIGLLLCAAAGFAAAPELFLALARRVKVASNAEKYKKRYWIAIAIAFVSLLFSAIWPFAHFVSKETVLLVEVISTSCIALSVLFSYYYATMEAFSGKTGAEAGKDMWGRLDARRMGFAAVLFIVGTLLQFGGTLHLK